MIYWFGFVIDTVTYDIKLVENSILEFKTLNNF